MGDELTFDDGVRVSKEEFIAAIKQADSLKKIADWLATLPGVQSVTLADYLLKSNPPQREFFLDLKLKNGSKINKILNVYDLGGNKFAFNGIREP